MNHISKGRPKPPVKPHFRLNLWGGFLVSRWWIGRMLSAVTEETKENRLRVLLRLKKTDWIPLLAMNGSVMLVWIVVFFSNGISSVHEYKDVRDIFYVAKYLYKIDNNENNIPKNQSDLKKIPFGLPLAIKILSLPSFGFLLPICVILVFGSASLSVLLFERFLSVWKIVEDPVLTSSLLSIFPMRYLTYHSVPSSDSIYLCTVFLAFILFKFRDIRSLSICLFFSCFFCDQGIVLCVTFFLHFFRISNYQKAFRILLSSAMGIICTSIVQYIAVGDFFGYLRHRFLNNDGFSMIPGKLFLESALSIEHLGPFHLFWFLFISMLIGMVFNVQHSFLFILYPLISFLYSTMHVKSDLFRPSISLEVFSVLIGMDSFIQNPKFKKGMAVFLIFYGFSALIIAKNSISYHR